MAKSSFTDRLAELTPGFIREKIGVKLGFALVVLCIVPLVALGVFSYIMSGGVLKENMGQNLEALASARAAAIKTHFRDRNNDMEVLLDTIRALRTKAYDQLSAVQQLKKRLIENYFTERMADLNVMSRAPVVAKALIAFQNAGAISGSEWKRIEKTFGPYLVQFQESYGYYDAYLVSTNGKILYTVAQESDLGQNLKSGKLKDSPAGKAFRRGLKDLIFQDFEPYEPADNAPAAFLACPIKVGNSLKGVIMVQASIDEINYIVQERTGLGKTGETYLLGSDGLFRCDFVSSEESTLMNPRYQITDAPESKDTYTALKDALDGNTGQAIMKNYKNIYVLVTWTTIHIEDQVWAMFNEITVAEAFIPKSEMSGEEEGADFFREFKKKYQFSDLALMEPNGELFYTVSENDDLDTNMLTGKYKDTSLGKLLKAVKEKKQTMWADYDKYKPIVDSNAKKKGKKTDPHVAFVAKPLLSGENLEVVAIAQLSSEENNEIMANYIGLGDTGETYLVGRDGRFRSKSKTIKDAVMNAKYKVKTEAYEGAFKDKKGGSGEIENYQGENVLSVWKPLTVVNPKETQDGKGITWAVIAEMGLGEISKPARGILLWIFLGLVGVIVIVVIVYTFLRRGLTTQIEHIADLFEEIDTGNLDARTEVVSRDELGVMARQLNAMLDHTMTLIQSSEERDAMQRSITKLLEEISGFAEGNLGARAEVTEDITGAIADSFNYMAEQLGNVVGRVKDVTLQVSATSKEVRTSTENLAETSEVQAVQVSDAIAAINEMAASIQQVAENASQSADVSEKSTKNAKEGATAVRDTNSAMDSIREHVQETARAIKRLGESSQEIGNIVQLINDIADRTSILALNASIQAAMAGEAGRGFAVVAEEVQRLAERSTNATKQIDTLIKNIQGEINEAGSSMEESIQRVVDGSRLADNAYSKLQEIESVTVQLGELIQSITMASKQQARASDNIAKTMEEVGEISSQTSAASRQTAVAMKNLADTSDRLNESVSLFKLEETTTEN